MTDANVRDEWSHIKPLLLILSTQEYIVFIDQEEDVNWETNPDFDEETLKDPHYSLQKQNSILNGEALLEATPTGNFDHPTRLSFKRLLGEAIARSFDYDYQGAEEMLASASQYIQARSEEKSRFWYLSASFLMAGAFLVVGVAFWIYREHMSLVLSPSGTLLALSSVVGAMGALLSVIWRSGSLQFDASAGRNLHYLEATSRICAGALSGFLVALAVKYDLILTAFSRDGNLEGVMMLAAFAGGTSERLAGSIISKFESTEGRAGHKGSNESSA
jgi:hypothetical protein